MIFACVCDEFSRPAQYQDARRMLKKAVSKAAGSSATKAYSFSTRPPELPRQLNHGGYVAGRRATERTRLADLFQHPDERMRSR